MRRVHWYLGLVPGIQFLLWTAGGLCFSWSDMDEIHGDHQRLPAPLIRVGQALVSPGVVLDSLQEMHPSLSLVSMQLIDLFGEPVYQVVYQAQTGAKDARKVQLAMAATGKMRGPLTRQEAIGLALNRFKGTPEVDSGRVPHDNRSPPRVPAKSAAGICRPVQAPQPHPRLRSRRTGHRAEVPEREVAGV